VLRPTAQERAEHLGVDRFEEMGIESGLIRSLLILEAAIAGDGHEEDGPVAWQGANPPGQLVAIKSGEPHVDERNVRIDGDASREPLFSSSGPFGVQEVPP
jgi:hypothetical protein